jgi:glycosyltransferase involved in cell wall biosynthesis
MSGAGSEAKERNDDLTVIVPTWNSATRLERALDTVERNLRPGKVVIVDRESEDSTRQIAERQGAEVLTDIVSLGSARMKGVRASDSEWVCFVDDDIGIPEEFTSIIEGKVDDSVGALQGAVISVHQPFRDILIDEYEGRFSGKDTFDLRPGERGLTSATLVRKDLIEDLELGDMDTWEDWLITQRIIDSGHRWVVTRPYVDHFHEYEDLAQKGGWNAAGVLNLARTGRIPRRQALRWYLDIALVAGKNAVRLPIRFRDPRLFFHQARLLTYVLLAPRHVFGVVPRKPRVGRT